MPSECHALATPVRDGDAHPLDLTGRLLFSFVVTAMRHSPGSLNMRLALSSGSCRFWL